MITMPTPIRFAFPAYTPRDWYWQIAGDPRVFSSGRGVPIVATDGDYLRWLGAGNQTTKIASWSELFDVLDAAVPDLADRIGPLFEANDWLQPPQIYRYRARSGVHVKFPDVPRLDGVYSHDKGTTGRLSEMIAFKSEEPLGWRDAAGLARRFTRDELTRLRTVLDTYRIQLEVSDGRAAVGLEPQWPELQLTA
jgi:hypothetical protein